MQTIRKLKNLDQSRQEFVSNVSHELKTPLTSIRVLADSLMGMENAPGSYIRSLCRIFRRRLTARARLSMIC